jgi:hypothetical protein
MPPDIRQDVEGRHAADRATVCRLFRPYLSCYLIGRSSFTVDIPN